MLLRNSISNTKKFFHKTLQNFKSLFFSDSYQKIPKTSPYNNHYSSSPIGTDMNIVQTSFNHNKDFDNLYNDRWNTDKGKGKEKGKGIKKKMIIKPSEPKKEKDPLNGSFMKFSKVNSQHHVIVKDYDEIQRKEDCSWNHNKLNRFQERNEERSLLVTKKMKELEMMDINNVEHVLDIEEVLHYYSRLTCPAYLDIVDNFFMDMYAEFFPTSSTTRI